MNQSTLSITEWQKGGPIKLWLCCHVCFHGWQLFSPNVHGTMPRTGFLKNLSRDAATPGLWGCQVASARLIICAHWMAERVKGAAKRRASCRWHTPLYSVFSLASSSLSILHYHRWATNMITVASFPHCCWHFPPHLNTSCPFLFIFLFSVWKNCRLFCLKCTDLF